MFQYNFNIIFYNYIKNNLFIISYMFYNNNMDIVNNNNMDIVNNNNINIINNNNTDIVYSRAIPFIDLDNNDNHIDNNILNYIESLKYDNKKLFIENIELKKKLNNYINKLN